MHRLRGFEENWYEASKTDGRCLEPIYRRSKSLSVQRVISRNPFCAVLSRSSLPKKGRRENEKPTKTMQLFNRARFLPLSLSRASFRYCFFIFSVLQAIGTLFLLALSRSRWSRVCAIDWHGNSISLWKLDELRV